MKRGDTMISKEKTLERLAKARAELLQEADRIRLLIVALDYALELMEKETNHGVDDKKPRKQG